TIHTISLMICCGVSRLSSRASKHEPETQLDESASVHCARDLPERGASPRAIGIRKIRPVEEIVELASKLHILFLRHMEILQQRSVEIGKTRTYTRRLGCI